MTDRQPPARGAGRARRPSWPHVHRFRWRGPDPFSSASFYACRCGRVSVGF